MVNIYGNTLFLFVVVVVVAGRVKAEGRGKKLR